MKKLFATLVLSSIHLALAEPPGAEALKLITEGVDDFDIGKSVPGVLRVNGDSAIPLLMNDEGRAFAAIGNATAGRVAAFSHGSFLKAKTLDANPSLRTLITNTVSWAGKAAQPSVGLSPSVSDLEPLLKKAGMRVQIVEPGRLTSRIDVFCYLGQNEIDQAGRDELRRFAMKGGGVVVAATPWPFAKKFSDFKTFPANEAANLAGIHFEPSGYASVKGKISLKMADPSAAIDAAKKLAGRVNPSERAQLISTLESGKTLIGTDFDAFRIELAKLNRAIGPIIPTKKDPVVPGRDPLIDAVMGLEDYFNQRMPAHQVKPILAAADYPGAVPKNTQRVKRAVEIDGKFKGWMTGRNAGGWNAKELRPTGLYAAPGELVHVAVPPEIVGQGFEIVIGAYRGGLNNRDKWNRYPRLQRRYPIGSAEIQVANGFGGLINIAVPPGADFGTLKLGFRNAVESPLYVHGKTSVGEWKSSIRSFPGPWAELASERMIIALPSSYIRRLNNPDEVMDLWNQIIDKSADLAVTNRDLWRAERIVFDRQTAAGSMHSGYPVAAHDGRSAEQAVDAESLAREGNWGFFHEYGHNHQHNLWSLPGTGETTCNLWSVYLSEELVGKPRAEAHGGVDPLRRRQRRNAYFDGGRRFASEWNVWTALDCYLLVQEEFGWEPFQKVFAEYNELPKDEWPNSQQEKNDQWVIRFSRACGVNLEPYYAAWNLPMSDKVAEFCAELPAWEENPVARYVKE